MRMNRVWMAVSQDEYQLPIAVAESANELAKMMGVSEASIRSSISRLKQKKSNRGRKRMYLCINMDEVEG